MVDEEAKENTTKLPDLPIEKGGYELYKSFSLALNSNFPIGFHRNLITLTTQWKEAKI